MEWDHIGFKILLDLPDLGEAQPESRLAVGIDRSMGRGTNRPNEEVSIGWSPEASCLLVHGRSQ